MVESPSDTLPPLVPSVFFLTLEATPTSSRPMSALMPLGSNPTGIDMERDFKTDPRQNGMATKTTKTTTITTPDGNMDGSMKGMVTMDGVIMVSTTRLREGIQAGMDPKRRERTSTIG